MQIGRLLRVRDGATDLGDRPVVRMAPISNWTRTTGLYGLLAVGDLDRGWLVARVWTLGIRAEGGVNMLARFGMFFLVRSGDCFRLLDGGTYRLDGDHHRQTFGFGCLDRGGVFCGGRVHFVACR